MGAKDYNKGRYDQKNDETYNPPHEKSPLRTLIDWDTKQEIADRIDYRQGWEDGKKK